jgi:hypothetical protein
MHTKIEFSEFHYEDFSREHSDDLIVIVGGSWYYESHTGEYEYQTRLGDLHSPTRKGKLSFSSSSNHAMLEGVLAAIERIKLDNRSIYVLSPTPLGFKKRKGPNVELINSIFDACAQKKLDFHSIGISNGGQLIRNLLEKKL